MVHDDLDSVLAVIARVLKPEIRSGKGREALREIYRREKLMDENSAATLDLSDDDIAELNAIAVPLAAPRTAALPARALARGVQLRECLERVQGFIMGDRPKVDVTSRYVSLSVYPQWSLVWESNPLARRQMLRDELGATIIMKGENPLESRTPPGEQENPTTPVVRAYTVQRLNKKSTFPLGPGFYGFMNYLRVLDASEERPTASVFLMLSHLRRMQAPERNFAAFADVEPGDDEAFGGSDMVGGGKTSIDPEVLAAAIEWYVEQGSRAPERTEREVYGRLSIVSDGTRKRTEAALMAG